MTKAIVDETFRRIMHKADVDEAGRKLTHKAVMDNVEKIYDPCRCICTSFGSGV